MPVEGNNTFNIDSDMEAKDDQQVNTIDGNNLCTTTRVDESETPKSSNNELEQALADMETQSPTHIDSSSQDGQ